MTIATPITSKPRVAIVGTGIAGLGCAHLLHPHVSLMLFEKNTHIGGHSNTVTVTRPDGLSQPIDTGFMVYNAHTYPNLCRLFDDLNVTGTPTDMSFSVTHTPNDITWCGSSLNQVFGQRKNILRPAFWKMVADLKRLCDSADVDLADPRLEHWTIGEYLQHHGYGTEVTNWFVLPMGSAIWSTAPEQMLDFPIRTLLRFYQNHRFLRLGGHLQWFTVPGGAKTYVERITQPFANAIQTNMAAQRVWQDGDQAMIEDSRGHQHHVDAVILACHADEALSLLQDATALEQTLLQHYPYEANVATLHTDARVLPPISRCWAAWNYRYDTPATNTTPPQASTHYWMNRLQHISGDTQYIVSINGETMVAPESVIATIPYTHPRFTLAGIAHQPRLPELNRQPDVNRYFCGSYFRYGFHEDAFTSAIHCARRVITNLSPQLGVTPEVWPDVP